VGGDGDGDEGVVGEKVAEKREVRSLGVWETRCVDKRDVRYWSLWGEGVDEGISGVTLKIFCSSF